MAGVDGDVVGQLLEPAQAVEEAFRTLGRADREVRPRGVADEQRVACEEEPLVDEQRAVLRPVSRRVDHPHADLADAQDVAVLDRVERVVRLGERVDRDACPQFERKPAVAGDVIGVIVRLDHANDP